MPGAGRNGSRTSGMSTAGSVACVASSMMTRLKRSPRSRRSSPAPVHVEHTTWRALTRAASSAALSYRGCDDAAHVVTSSWKANSCWNQASRAHAMMFLQATACSRVRMCRCVYIAAAAAAHQLPWHQSKQGHRQAPCLPKHTSAASMSQAGQAANACPGTAPATRSKL